MGHHQTAIEGIEALRSSRTYEKAMEQTILMEPQRTLALDARVPGEDQLELTFQASPPLPPPPETFECPPPPLPEPESYLSRHLRVIAQNVEQSGLRKKETEEEWIRFISGELTELSHEASEKIRESIEKYNESWIWSVLRKVGETILSAISIIFGVSLVATGAGTVVGGLLIASGILSLVNLVCVETKLWDKFAAAVAGNDKELRKQLRTWIPGAIGLASGVMGAVGSLGAILFSTLNLTQKGILIANTAVNVAESVTTMGEGVVRSEHIHLQSERDHLQTRVDLTNSDLERSVKFLEKHMAGVQRNFHHAWRFLDSASRTTENILIRG